MTVITAATDRDAMNQAAEKLNSPSLSSLPFLPVQVMEVIEGLEGASNCANYIYMNSSRETPKKTATKEVRGRAKEAGKGKKAAEPVKRKRSLSVKKPITKPDVTGKKLAKQQKKEEVANAKEKKAEERKRAAEQKRRLKEAETQERKRSRELAKKLKLHEEQERKLLDKHRGALLKSNRERRRLAQDKVNQRFFVEEASSTVRTDTTSLLTSSIEDSQLQVPRLTQHLPQDFGPVLVVWNFLHCFSAPLGMRAIPHWSEL